MSNPRIPVTEDELHAYIDNELPAERRGDVEAWLAAHPDDAERVQSWQSMAEMLHARYDAVANEPVPKRLQPPAPKRRWLDAANWPQFAGMAAARPARARRCCPVSSAAAGAAG